MEENKKTVSKKTLLLGAILIVLVAVVVLINSSVKANRDIINEQANLIAQCNQNCESVGNTCLDLGENQKACELQKQACMDRCVNDRGANKISYSCCGSSCPADPATSSNCWVEGGLPSEDMCPQPPITCLGKGVSGGSAKGSCDCERNGCDIIGDICGVIMDPNLTPEQDCINNGYQWCPANSGGGKTESCGPATTQICLEGAPRACFVWGTCADLLDQFSCDNYSDINNPGAYPCSWK